MALRIVSEDGNGYKARIYDVATGEDVTTSMHVINIDITMPVNGAVQAVITSIIPQIDIMVENVDIRRVCPYCGHETKDTTEPVEEIDEALAADGYRRNLEIMQRDPGYARRAGIDNAIRIYEEHHKDKL